MSTGTRYVPAGASALTVAENTTVSVVWPRRSPIIWGSDFITIGASPADIFTVTNFAVLGRSSRAVISDETSSNWLRPEFSITIGIMISLPAVKSFRPDTYALRFGDPPVYFTSARAGTMMQAAMSIRNIMRVLIDLVISILPQPPFSNGVIPRNYQDRRDQDNCCKHRHHTSGGGWYDLDLGTDSIRCEAVVKGIAVSYIGIEIIGGWGCLAVSRDRIQGSNGLAWCNITEICHGIGA